MCLCSRYPPVTSDSERHRYKADFTADYSSYLRLHDTISQRMKMFSALSDRLKLTTQDSPEYEVLSVTVLTCLLFCHVIFCFVTLLLHYKKSGEGKGCHVPAKSKADDLHYTYYLVTEACGYKWLAIQYWPDRELNPRLLDRRSDAVSVTPQSHPRSLARALLTDFLSGRNLGEQSFLVTSEKIDQ